MVIAIVGSRDWTDYELLKDSILKRIRPSTITEIVSGGARGADALAERFAKEFNIPLKVFPAEWDKYGKSAGYKRNALIIGRCDIAFAFQINGSKGTQHSIDIAKAQHKQCWVTRRVQWESA